MATFESVIDTLVHKLFIFSIVTGLIVEGLSLCL